MLAYFDTNLWNSTLPSAKYSETLKNKNILLVNTGGRYKYHLMKRLHALGMGHIAVLDTPADWYSPFVDGIISAEAVMPLHENDARLEAIKVYANQHNIVFDGVWTFADKSVVLCAQIAHHLGLPGISPEIIIDLKNKELLREWLFEHKDTLGKNVAHVHALHTLDPEKVDETDYPVIIKGKESAGKSLIHIVHTYEEMMKFVERYGRKAITLEHYFEGTDIDLNVLVKNGKIEWSGFVENLPAIQPGFLEDGSICHHCITEAEQAEIVTYMQNILDQSGGIQTACLHVEFRICRDEDGFAFTLIEINFRMGGVENFSFHLGRDNHDLILSNLELACGLPLTQAAMTEGKGQYPYMGNRNIYSDRCGTLADIVPPPVTPPILEYLFYAPENMECTFPPGPNDDIGWIVAGSNESPEAVENALDRSLLETKVIIR